MDIDQVADIKRHFLHFLLLSRKNTSSPPASLPHLSTPVPFIPFPSSCSLFSSPVSLIPKDHQRKARSFSGGVGEGVPLLRFPGCKHPEHAFLVIY